MALIKGTLTEGKPIIEVTLADALPAPPHVSPQSDQIEFSVRQYRALLDTGADITCLCDHVVAECRLRQAGFTRLVGGVGPSLHATYIVRLGLLCGSLDSYEMQTHEPRGLFQLEPLEAAVIRDNQWFDLIIGTDILSQHEFSLTKGGGFKLELS